MIRMATVADEPHLQYLADRQQEELDYRIEQDREGTLALVAREGSGAVVYIAFDGEKPVGWIGGYIGSRYYDKTLYALIDPIYVVPEARGRPFAFDLLVEFENWASTHHVTTVAIGVPGKAVGARRLLKALGYQTTEIVYTKEMK